MAKTNGKATTTNGAASKKKVTRKKKAAPSIPFSGTRLDLRSRNESPREILNEIDETFASSKADYYAAQSTHYLPTPRGVNPLGTSADYHYRYEFDYMLMLERARYFDRDNMIVGQGVNRLVANILQDGFILQPETGDDQLNEDHKQWWNDWATRPDEVDHEGERDFCEIESLVFRTMLVDGDLIALPIRSGATQIIEAHRLRNPFGSRNGEVIHGVELSTQRRRTAYHLIRDELSPIAPVTRANRFRRIAARDSDGNRQVLHVYNPKRQSQTRGVTAFAPTVIPANFHDDLQFANVIKAKRASFIAIFREQQGNTHLPGAGVAGARTTETQSDGTSRTFESQAPGQEIKGKPGEVLKGFSPNIPNPEFFQHASLLLSIVAVNLDLPPQAFMLDPTATNFSGWRGAMDQARLRFVKLQQLLRSKFHTPLYVIKTRQRMAQDPAFRRAMLRAGDRAMAHTWALPVAPYIEPLKDATADDLQVSKNLTSPRRRAQRRGLDWKKLVPEIVEDRALLCMTAKEQADQINQTYPDMQVDWRELAYGREGSDMSSSASQMAQDEQDEQDRDQERRDNANQSA